ncbi:hypothetical protein BC830DRAFT_641346 [Chytriomyces sp. MP71]|nr:hypothetical protein BC830DRAFT_641346 [Chytriomyces sp. MP71]
MSSGASGQHTVPGEEPIHPQLPMGLAASVAEPEHGPLGAYAGNAGTGMANYGTPHAENSPMGFAFNAVYAPPPPALESPDQTESQPPQRSLVLSSGGNMRNTYTIEMKIKVAERGLEKGRNVAAKEFGLNASMVGRVSRLLCHVGCLRLDKPALNLVTLFRSAPYYI